MFVSTGLCLAPFRGLKSKQSKVFSTERAERKTAPGWGPSPAARLKEAHQKPTFLITDLGFKEQKEAPRSARGSGRCPSLSPARGVRWGWLVPAPAAAGPASLALWEPPCIWGVSSPLLGFYLPPALATTRAGSVPGSQREPGGELAVVRPVWLGFAALQIPRPSDYLYLIAAGADLLFAMKTTRWHWEPSLPLGPSCPPRRSEAQTVCVRQEPPRATPGPSTALIRSQPHGQGSRNCGRAVLSHEQGDGGAASGRPTAWHCCHQGAPAPGEGEGAQGHGDMGRWGHGDAVLSSPGAGGERGLAGRAGLSDGFQSCLPLLFPHFVPETN